MTIKEQYRKARRRVQNLIRSYKLKGYDVEIEIPQLVKKPTRASIRVLEKITPDKVRRNAFTPDLETGEKINYYSFKYRYPKAKSPSALQAAQLQGAVYAPDMAIEFFRRTVNQYPEKTQRLALNGLEGAINVYGTRKVDEALEKMIDAGDIVDPKDAYNYRLVLEMMETLASLLRISDSELEEIHNDVLGELDSQEYYEGEFEDW